MKLLLQGRAKNRGPVNTRIHREVVIYIDVDKGQYT